VDRLEKIVDDEGPDQPHPLGVHMPV
jgi:hypothetical protein